MDKKTLKKQFKEKEKEEQIKLLPTNIKYLKELLDFLDEKLEKCDHSFKLTKEFIKIKDLDEQSLIIWLKDNGGYCDCEVLANIEDKIEELS